MIPIISPLAYRCESLVLAVASLTTMREESELLALHVLSRTPHH